MAERTVWQGSSGDDSFLGPEGPNQGFVLARTIPNLTGVSVDASFGDDFLRGTGFADILDGEEGADTIEGGAGNDSLRGVGGLDYLHGEAGDDFFFEQDAGAADAAAVLDGGAGIDTLVMDSTLRFAGTLFTSIEVLQARGVDDSLTINAAGFAGFTRIEFWSAPLQFLGLGGTYDFARLDLIFARGSDLGVLFTGSAAAETVIGSARGDVLDGGAGANLLQGGLGADTLSGSGTLEGGEEADSLTGAAGADVLRGGVGADTLVGGAGDDLLEGGAGFDVARLAGLLADAVLTDLGGGVFTLATTAEGLDTLRGVERLAFADGVLDQPSSGVATTGADFLIGGAAGDFLNGRAGEDTLLGLGGADTLWGSDDDDALEGGEGDDWLLGKEAADQLFGDADADTLDGGMGADTLRGGEGADRLVGRQEADLLLGEAGADTLFGADGADTLEGGADADGLRGGAGADVLRGGAENDTLRGEEGADTLAGGTGRDRLHGGAGADVFFFAAPGEGADRILDFALGEDLLALSAPGFGRLPGALNPNFFESNTTGETSLTADGVLTYMHTTGRLFWDADGVGGLARVEIALLRDAPALSAESVVLIA